jgi:hypothetical protein
MRRAVWLLLLTVSFALSENIGEVLSVKGNPQIFRGEGSVLAVSGDIVQEGDQIKTGSRARVKLLLKDGTAITVGKNSDLKIDEYLYLRYNRRSKLKASLHTGVMRVVTGAIGKVVPHRFKIKTRTSTIGVRGTDFIVYSSGKTEKFAVEEGAISINSGGKEYTLKESQFLQLTGRAYGRIKKLTESRLMELYRELYVGDREQNKEFSLSTCSVKEKDSFSSLRNDNDIFKESNEW